MPHKVPQDYEYDVIVAGGGPVGMFLACRLVRLGIRVLVLERDLVPEAAVRAMGYYGSTQYALQNAGIFDECKSRGFFQTEFSWRKTTKQVGLNERQWGDLVAVWNPWEGSDIELGQCGTGMLILGQNELRDICKSRLDESDLVTVIFDQSVIDVEQKAESVNVTADDSSGMQRKYSASFLVGADGGKSTVRKLMGQTLQGWTWPQTVVGSDLMVELPPPSDGPLLAYLLDKKDAGFLCPLKPVKRGAPTLYRFTVPMDPEDCEPQVFDQKFREKVDLLVPGKRPLEYEIVRVAKYTTHQRQVQDYLVGRTMLVGDAAHLNTPTGGLGLTTGLLDADSLADTFDMYFNEQKPFGLFRVWADLRHGVWKNMVSPMSKENQERFLCADPENPKADPFLKMILEKSPELAALNKQFDRDLITRMREVDLKSRV